MLGGGVDAATLVAVLGAYICIYIHIYKDSAVERVRVGAAVHPGAEVGAQLRRVGESKHMI